MSLCSRTEVSWIINFEQNILNTLHSSWWTIRSNLGPDCNCKCRVWSRTHPPEQTVRMFTCCLTCSRTEISWIINFEQTTSERVNHPLRPLTLKTVNSWKDAECIQLKVLQRSMWTYLQVLQLHCISGHQDEHTKRHVPTCRHEAGNLLSPQSAHFRKLSSTVKVPRTDMLTQHTCQHPWWFALVTALVSKTISHNRFKSTLCELASLPTGDQSSCSSK